jgi:hypothetical protein
MFGDLSRTSPEKPNEINEGGKAKVSYAHTRTREEIPPIGDKLDTSRGQVGELLPDCSEKSDEKANVFNGSDKAKLEHIDSDIREESPP